MIKNLLLFCFLPLFSVSTNAQEAEKASKWELGANITNLVNQIFNSDGNIGNQSPYVLVGNFVYNEKKSLRLGVGMNLRASTFSEGLENVGQLDVIRDIRTNFRIGLEYRKQVAKKWRLHYGFDVVGNVSSFKTEQGDFGVARTVSDFISGGIGPILGFAFKPNENISIWTESTWYFTYNHDKTKFSFDNFPQNEIKTIENSVTANITVPLSLFISFKL